MKKEMRIKLNTRYFSSFLLALLAIIVIFAPYQEGNTLSPSWLHSTLLVVNYVLLGLALLFLIPNYKKDDLNKSSFLAMTPAIFLFVLNFFHSYLDAELGGLTTMAWILFCIFPTDMKERTFKIFKTFWWATCAIGIICFLCYLLNLPLPYQEVSYYFGGSNMTYINYGVSFLYKYDSTFRLCGICNEPGYLGTFCALILCVDALSLKKKGNMTIFLAGILSFSLAFFLIIIAYWLSKTLIVAHRDTNRGHKLLRYGLVLLALFGYLVVLPNIETGNSIIDRTIRRTVITSEGLTGDNRTNEDFDFLYSSLSPMDLIAGMGRGYVKASGVTDVSSYKVYIVDYGLLASLILWGSLLVAALYKNTKNNVIVVFVLAFFASIYQRPNIFTLGYAIVLFGGIEYIKHYALSFNNKKEKIDAYKIN